jgi:hypothetical protein
VVGKAARTRLSSLRSFARPVHAASNSTHCTRAPLTSEAVASSLCLRAVASDRSTLSCCRTLGSAHASSGGGADDPRSASGAGEPAAAALGMPVLLLLVVVVLAMRLAIGAAGAEQQRLATDVRRVIASAGGVCGACCVCAVCVLWWRCC